MKSGMLAAEEVYRVLTAQSEKSVADGEQASSFESIEPSSYQVTVPGVLS